MNLRSPTQTKAESSFTPVQTGLLQRQCASCGQHTIAGGECTECQKKRSPLQRRSANQTEPSEVPPIVGEVLRLPSQSLDAAPRAFRKSRFGQDLSSVRVHTDAKVAELGRIKQSAQYMRYKFGVQPKLTIDALGDKYEQEADQMAAQVMSMPASSDSSPQVQRFGEEDNPVQGRSLAQSITPVVHRCVDEQVQRHESVQQAFQLAENQASGDLERRLNASKGGGLALAPEVRAFMELRFGADFSSVRVHTGSEAVQMNRELGAQAFTHKSDIYYGEGKSPAKDDLTAHELTHVVQQTDIVRNINKPILSVSSQVKQNLTNVSTQLQRQPDPDECSKMVSSSDKNNTFFGQTIPGNITKTLRQKLLEAQSKAKLAMCLNGKDPNSFVLTKKIITYPGHSPAQEKAVDIDVSGQPYLMHEVTKKKPETDIDKEVAQVYNRIAFWGWYGKSIIPNGITTVTRPSKSSSTQRTWTNPNTAKRESITTGELYDLLHLESEAMQHYFNLLTKSDKDLEIEVESFLGLNSEPVSNITKLGLPTDNSAKSLQAFRQRISDDYRLLGGSKKQLEALAGKAIANSSKEPPSHHGDRPFEGDRPDRKPELGFLTLPKEVVVALTDVGLVWGAIDFGGGSGDVMHFDCRALPNC